MSSVSNQLNLQKYIVNINEYKQLQQIESDGIGTSYLVQDLKNGEECLAKVLNSQKKEEAFKQVFDPDIGTLIKCQHPTICKFIGYSLIDFSNHENLTVFLAHPKKGRLDEFLKKVRSGTQEEKYDNTNRQILLIGIARSMMYLHRRQIIHQDLKPSNILLDENLYPYLADFALSSYYQSTQQQSPTASIYLAPEVLKGKPFSGKAAVYSFAIIMYEIVTDSPAYPQLLEGKITEQQLVKKITNDNLRPQFKTPIKSSIQKLIEKCWSKDPKERPTFEYIYLKLTFNLGLIYDDQEKEIKTYDPNKYYLENVNAAEIAYYFEIIEKSNEIIKYDVMKKFDFLNERLENAMKPLEEENSKLRNENQELVKKIDDLHAENEDIKARLNMIEQRFAIRDKSDSEKVTINDFNEQQLQEQQAIITKIVSKNMVDDEDVYSYFTIVKLLLHYLLKLKVKKSASYFHIYSEDDKEVLCEIKREHQIRLTPECTELLIHSHLINSVELNNILSQFDDVLIKLKYPSSSFQQDYKSIFKELRKTKEDRIIIAILISGIAQTDQMFNDNAYISYVKIEDPSKQTTNGTFVTTIREYSFSGCTSLTQITIPSCVTEIGEGAFNDCVMLTNITLPPSITEIKKVTFNKCSSLTEIEIPSNVTAIGDNAFKDCSSLRDILIPPSVVSIGEGTFNGCTSLTTISIPSSVTEIKDGTFNKCTSLTSVELPSSVTVIGLSAFNKCTNLENIILPPHLTKIGRYAFTKCTSLAQISLPSTVVEIGRYAFMECSSLAKISIPSSVTEIKSKTFEGCTSLKHASIPFSVTKIGDNAFTGCTSLTKISMPSSVTEIGEDAFPTSTEIVEKVLA